MRKSSTYKQKVKSRTFFKVLDSLFIGKTELKGVNMDSLEVRILVSTPFSKYKLYVTRDLMICYEKRVYDFDKAILEHVLSLFPDEERSSYAPVGYQYYEGFKKRK